MGEIKFDIRVINDKGSPNKSCKVTVFDDAFLGTSHSSSYTNSDGWASFEFYCVSGNMKIKVFIEGNFVGKTTIGNNETTSFVY